MDKKTRNTSRDELREDDAVGELLHLAGRPPEMPEPVFADLKRAAHAIWQEKVHSRAARRRSRARWLALAAAVALAAGAGLWIERRAVAPTAPAVVASLAAHSGGASFSAGETTIVVAELGAGAGVVPGTVVSTGEDGHVALRLAGGSEVRLDNDSRLELRSSATLALSRGAVYLDSGRSGSEAVEVRTPFGVARDLGTQFEVRLEPGGLRVQVREGEILLDREGDDLHSVPAGTVLSVAADGTVTREEVAGYGPSWDWIFPAGSGFQLDGSTLGEFLDWLMRETGWRIEWQEDGLASEVRGETTFGSIEGLRPEEALRLVLPSAGLSYRLEDGVLGIESSR